MIPVPERLTKPHPVLDLTRREAHAAKDGWIDTRHQAGMLHLRIHKQSLRRVLLLAQALVTEADRRGYAVGIEPGYGCPGGLAITIDGTSSELVFLEETDRVAHEATDRTKRRTFALSPVPVAISATERRFRRTQSMSKVRPSSV
jgi:hypothetical protein